jgi:exopolyphosphatase/guanosine-5'-triphosphate,3'-diphosphate pyrophosphatase
VKCLHAHVAWYLAGGDDPVGCWTAKQIGVRRSDFAAETTRHGSVAAVDCGTNSTRLLVARSDGAVLDRQMRITRLGKGVDATRKLSPDAMERTFQVLRMYRHRMDELGVVRTRVVATSAARDASNADEFLTGLTDIVGVSSEMLSGEEEGELSFAGATTHLPAGSAEHGPVLVADIGGGSTELIVGVPATGSHTPDTATRSLDIGCVRISERYLEHDPPRPSELEAARDAVRATLADARDILPPLMPSGLMIGLAGTVSTIARLKLGVNDYDREAIHHSVLTRDDANTWIAQLAGEDRHGRLARPGMVAGREDVIVGGALVLAEIMSSFERAECLVSEDDILDGLAATLLARQVER